MNIENHKNAEKVIRYYLSFMPPRGCESILDIGAGKSVPYKGVLQTRCKKYVSCDIRKSSKVDYEVDITKQLPFADKSFDWGWSIETMEHIPQKLQKKAFEEIIRVCKNLVMTFPTAKHPTFDKDPGHTEVIINPNDYIDKLNFIDKSTKSGRNIWIFADKNKNTEVKKGNIFQEGYNEKYYRIVNNIKVCRESKNKGYEFVNDTEYSLKYKQFFNIKNNAKK